MSDISISASLCISFCVIIGVGLCLIYMNKSPDLGSLFNDLDTAHNAWYVIGDYRDWGFEPLYAYFLRMVDSVTFGNYTPEQLQLIKTDFFLHVDLFNKLHQIRDADNLVLNQNMWNIASQIQAIDPDFNFYDYTARAFSGMTHISYMVESSTHQLIIEMIPYLTS